MNRKKLGIFVNWLLKMIKIIKFNCLFIFSAKFCL